MSGSSLASLCPSGGAWRQERAMRTQGLHLKHHEVGEALGTLGRTTRALGAMRRLFAAHAVGGQRALAVVLVLQLVASAVLVVLMAGRSPVHAPPPAGRVLHARRCLLWPLPASP